MKEDLPTGELAWVTSQGVPLYLGLDKVNGVHQKPGKDTGSRA